MSIILPCANEDHYAVKTIESILAHSDMDLIAEIIIVDDGSEVPLESIFPKDLASNGKVKFIRHEGHVGLTPSRQDGANIAEGDVLFFMDCHCAVSDNWIEPILRGIAENPKRVMVPQTTSMVMDKWTVDPHDTGYGSGSRMKWDGFFEWFTFHDDQNVMVLTGCLVGVLRSWWEELGGYDITMHGWGGENIETALRIWLCGGEIMWTKDSKVAHMWGGQKPPSHKKYSVPAGSAKLNTYRAVAVWADEFVEKFATFGVPSGEISLSPMKEIKERMQCKHFSYFLDKFHKFYHWAGMLPRTTFQIREETSGLCIESRSDNNVILSDCGETEDQLWHEANQDGEKCCSGFSLWNKAKCMRSTYFGAKVSLAGCSFHGQDSSQQISLTDSGQLRLSKWDDACILTQSARGPRVTLSQCDSTVQQQIFRVSKREQDGSMRFESTTRPEFCLSVLDEQLQLVKCSSFSSTQAFKHDTYLMPVRSVDKVCLDAGSGGTNGPITYNCYTHEVNENQRVHLVDVDADLKMIQFANDQCIKAPEFQEDSSKVVSMRNCLREGFQLHHTLMIKVSAGSDGKFTITHDGSYCLAIGKDNKVVTNTSDSSCDLWESHPNMQIRHVEKNLCLDAAGGTPIIYGCYSSGNPNQEWLSENNRLYNNGKCLSYSSLADEAILLEVGDCSDELRFSKFNERVPLEAQLYQKYALAKDWGYPKQ